MLSYYEKKFLDQLKNRKSGAVISDNNREILFESFYEENLHFTEECLTFSDLRELNQEYDAFICGSDQIWSPCCFDPHYYLDFVENPKKMIAYAPSVGLSQIDDPSIASEIEKLASRFTWISTREKSGSELIADLIGRDVQTVLDPTLLIDEKEWCCTTGT